MCNDVGYCSSFWVGVISKIERIVGFDNNSSSDVGFVTAEYIDWYENDLEWDVGYKMLMFINGFSNDAWVKEWISWRESIFAWVGWFSEWE